MRIALARKETAAENTMAFWFQPERPLRFVAGQFGDFTFPGAQSPGPADDTRTLSLASSPNNRELMIATRMSGSAFKERLQALPLGAELEFTGPMGQFTLHSDIRHPAVFLTGGIGITPVRSIVEFATQERLGHSLFVFYSNRTRAASAFLPDFAEWAEANPNLQFVPTLTDEQPLDWSYELGKIEAPMLERFLPDLHRSIFYVVGPPAMVVGMRELLRGLGIDKDTIRSEDFTGY